MLSQMLTFLWFLEEYILLSLICGSLKKKYHLRFFLENDVYLAACAWLIIYISFHSALCSHMDCINDPELQGLF